MEDAAIIRGLVDDYVRDKRTIIMAVMDARNNLANQEVFRIAKAADREGFRTVGILTKCDAVQKGDEKTVRDDRYPCVEKLYADHSLQLPRRSRLRPIRPRRSTMDGIVSETARRRKSRMA